jgi:predicted transcriptional regulator
MSARERILALLKTQPEGLDDDVITVKLGFAQRQQANARCRELEREGVIERRLIGGKIRNFLTSVPKPTEPCVVTVPAGVNVESANRGVGKETSSVL